MSTIVYAKFRCTALRIKRALEIFRELMPPTTTTTSVAFWDPHSWSKNRKLYFVIKNSSLVSADLIDVSSLDS